MRKKFWKNSRVCTCLPTILCENVKIFELSPLTVRIFESWLFTFILFGLRGSGGSSLNFFVKVLHQDQHFGWVLVQSVKVQISLSYAEMLFHGTLKTAVMWTRRDAVSKTNEANQVTELSICVFGSTSVERLNTQEARMKKLPLAFQILPSGRIFGAGFKFR